jgi:FkbM family methyltransferase
MRLRNIQRHWRNSTELPRFRDKILYAYGRVLRRTCWPLFGRNSAVDVNLRGHDRPFHVRLASTDWLVLEEIFHQNEYGFVQARVKEARWIVDLGSNAGFSIRYWATLFPKAQIIAVEPDPNNCRTCEKNLAAAGLANRVSLVQAGVGASHRRVSLTSDSGEWGYRTVDSTSAAERIVELQPLVEILDEFAPRQEISLLKCDIEGAERELFSDCRSWIGRIRAIAIELHPPYCLDELIQDLSNGGAKFEVAAHVNRKLCPVFLLVRGS